MPQHPAIGLLVYLLFFFNSANHNIGMTQSHERAVNQLCFRIEVVGSAAG
jgi:hypothetical protein